LVVFVVVFVVDFVVSTVGAGAAIDAESMGGVAVVVVVVVDAAPTSPAAVPPAGALSLSFAQAPTATRVARAAMAVIALTRMFFSFLQ
jgi:hypothetical protein